MHVLIFKEKLDTKFSYKKVKKLMEWQYIVEDSEKCRKRQYSLKLSRNVFIVSIQNI